MITGPTIVERLDTSQIESKVDALTTILRGVVSLLPLLGQPTTSFSTNVFQSQLDALQSQISLSNRINTLSNVAVNNISGLAAGDIPNLSGSYLGLGGGTLSGALDNTSTGTSTWDGNFHVKGQIKIGENSAYLSENGLQAGDNFTISTTDEDAALTLQTLGRVGVATTTPWAVLSVEKNGANASMPIMAVSDDDGAAPFFLIDYLGHVGIGTSSPSDTFAINGATFIGNISAPSNTANRLYANSGSLYWAGNVIGGATTGNWTSNGTDVWRAGGKVGIGTSTPNTALTVAGTHVSGVGLIQARGISSSGYISVDTDSPSTQEVGFIWRGTGLAWYAYKPAGTADLVFYDGIADRVTFKSGGNVGINTITPAYKLDVSGAGHFTTFVDASHFVATSTTASSFPYASTTAITASGTGFFGNLVNSALTPGRVPFASTGGLLTDSASLTFSGNTLSVSSQIYAASGLYLTNKSGFASPTDGVMTIWNWANNDFSRLQLGGTTSAFPAIKRNGAGIDFRLADDSAYASTTFSSFSAAGTTGTSTIASGQGFTIGTSQFVLQKGSGNVGIGTASPTSPLHVSVGAIDVIGLFEGTGGVQARIAVNTIDTSADSIISFNNNGTTRWSIGNEGAGNVDSLVFSPSTGLASPMVTILQNGNVGIGTTSPYSMLSVAGQVVAQNYVATSTTATSTFSGGLTAGGSLGLKVLAGGTASFGNTNPDASARLKISDDLWITGTSKLVFGSSDSSPIFRFQSISGDVSQNDLTFRTYRDYFFETDSGSGTAGTNRLTIKGSTGNVGIGTTSPGTILHVRGSTPILTIDSSGATENSWLYFQQNGTLRSAIGYRETNAGLTFFESGSDRMVIKNGNVGIGTTTPAAKLAVSVTSTSVDALRLDFDAIGGGRWAINPYVSGVTNNGLSFVDKTSGLTRLSISQLGDLSLGGTLSLPSGLPVGSRVIHIVSTSTTAGEGILLRRGGDQSTGLNIWEFSGNSYFDNYYNNDTSQLNFRTKAGGTPVTAMTILGSGNVGIGTTTPWAQLSASSTSANPALAIQQNSTGAAAVFLGGNVGIGSTTPWAKLSVKGSGTGTGLAFAVSDSSDVARLVIQDNGNVGIGTTSPGYKLDLSVGNSDGIRISSSNSAQLRLDANSGNSSDRNWGLVTNYQANGDFVLVKSTAAGGSLAGGTQVLYSNLSGDIGLGAVNGALTSANMVIKSTGNVGIGSTTPWAKLSVKGSGTGTGLAFAVSDSSDVARLVIQDGGNVGIGTTTPGSKLAIGGTAVDADTAFSIANAAGARRFSVLHNGAVGIGATPDATKAYLSVDNGIRNYYDAASSQTNWYTHVQHWGVAGGISSLGGTQFISQGASADQGQNFVFGRQLTTGTAVAHMVISNTGNVGIGTTTPDATLQLGLYTRFRSGTWADPTTPNATTFSSGERINFYKDANYNTAIGMLANNGIWMQAHSSATDPLLQLWSGAVGGAPSAKMTVTIAGNVGIGTTSPTLPLSVTASGGKSAYFSGFVGVGTNAPTRDLTVSAASAGSIAGISGNNEFDMYFDPASAWLMTQGSGSSDITIAPNNVAAVTVKKTTGNVGIGTASPGAKLQVDSAILINGTTNPYLQFTSTGGSAATAYLQINNGVLELYGGTNKNLSLTTNGTGNVLIPNGNVGIGTTSPWKKLSVTGTVGFDGLTAGAGAGSLCLTATREVAYSDNAGCTGSSLRFKHDINDLDATSGIEEAMRLRPVSFIYNNDIGVKGEQVGFIAEDVAQVDQRLVTYDTGGTPNNVKYSNMVAIAIKAIQELWVKVQDLGQKVAALLQNDSQQDEEIENLKARLDALEHDGGSNGSQSSSDTPSPPSEPEEPVDEDTPAGDEQPAEEEGSTAEVAAPSDEESAEDEPIEQGDQREDTGGATSAAPDSAEPSVE